MISIGELFLKLVTIELYRRQYREERALPWFEQPDIGGES